MTEGPVDPPPAMFVTTPEMVRLGDVEIDGAGLRVAWNGSAVHLPPREMAAMLALARDVGAPVASAELARRIWPGSAMVTPYDVRRVVHQLRVLLRSSGTPIHIRNVHGVGYGLELDRPDEAAVVHDTSQVTSPGHIQDISRPTPGVETR